MTVNNILNSGLGIGIGYQAGGYNVGSGTQGSNAVAIGYNAGKSSQGSNSVAIGEGAGQSNQSPTTVAIGFLSGQSSQGSNSVALGYRSGSTSQSEAAVAVGAGAGDTSQGKFSVAVGFKAGFTSQNNNTIILNSTGNELNSSTSGAFYVAPVRSITSPAPNATNYSLTYDSSTNEIYYSSSNWTLSSTTASLLTSSSAAQAISFTQTSDYRVKENIEEISETDSSQIYKLNPVKYKNTMTGKKDYGFLAHEVQKVFPSIVYGEKDQEDGLQSINYTSLIPLLLKEIQELKATVQELCSQPL